MRSRPNDALDAALAGDPLRVLAATARSTDPLALALRATALGQLGETDAGRALADRAARSLAAAGRHVDALRARLVEAELATWALDLPHARRSLVALAHALAAAGDHANAAWARVTAARAAHLQGDAEGAALLLALARDEAEDRVPSHVAAVLALAQAEHAARGIAAEAAHDALARARALAGPRESALTREIARFAAELAAPAARLDGRDIDLGEVARVLADPSTIVVDACRARVSSGGAILLDLAMRPVLFDLVVALARVSPSAVPVDVIVRDAFGARVSNASYEARLRVELGRLRRALGDRVGRIVLARRQICWESSLPIVVVEPLVPRREARLLAVLADGRAWPARALADVLGQSPRTVQRLLGELADAGAVVALGRGPARRWVAADAAPRIASFLIGGGAPPGEGST